MAAEIAIIERTDWEILHSKNGILSVVWSQTVNDNPLTITVPAGTTKVNEIYLLRIRSNVSERWTYHPFYIPYPDDTIDIPVEELTSAEIAIIDVFWNEGVLVLDLVSTVVFTNNTMPLSAYKGRHYYYTANDDGGDPVKIYTPWVDLIDADGSIVIIDSIYGLVDNVEYTIFSEISTNLTDAFATSPSIKTTHVADLPYVNISIFNSFSDYELQLTYLDASVDFDMDLLTYTDLVGRYEYYVGIDAENPTVLYTPWIDILDNGRDNYTLNAIVEDIDMSTVYSVRGVVTQRNNTNVVLAQDRSLVFNSSLAANIETDAAASYYDNEMSAYQFAAQIISVATELRPYVEVSFKYRYNGETTWQYTPWVAMPDTTAYFAQLPNSDANLMIIVKAVARDVRSINTSYVEYNEVYINIWNN